MHVSVIIAGGGSGTRMGGDLPKQFQHLAGVPVLVRTVRRFAEVLPDAALYLSLPSEYHGLWTSIAAEHSITDRCKLCLGGETRFDSVKGTLALVSPCDIILVHDAVRPLVPARVIRAVVEGAALTGACIPVVEPVDTFRRLLPDGTSTLQDRAVLRAVQTPQGFGYEILKKAYDRPFDPSFTDDASVVESTGRQVSACAGSPLNIKLTRPEDMVLAEAALRAGLDN